MEIIEYSTMKSAVLVFFGLLALSSAAVLRFDEDQEDFTLYRQKREEPRLFGGGGANGLVQHGTIGLQNPNGSGGQVSYGHAKGYGHDVGVDAMIPVWSRQSRYGQSTLNVGGGASHHFGGPGGSHLTDKRVGINFVHRF